MQKLQTVNSLLVFFLDLHNRADENCTFSLNHQWLYCFFMDLHVMYTKTKLKLTQLKHEITKIALLYWKFSVRLH